MKKQIALILISILAVMPAGAKTINNKTCTQFDAQTNFCRQNCIRYSCRNMNECPDDLKSCYADGNCKLPFFVPENNCNTPCFPNIQQKPQCPVIPDLPDTPVLPDEQEKPVIPEVNPDTPVIPDEPVIPETPEIPDEPIVPEKPENDTNTSTPSDNIIETLLSLINNERVKNGIAALTYDESLELCAYVRAKEIKTSFSHTRPNGTSCFTVLDEYNYKYSTAGENIAYGQETAEEVFNDWMNSQGHRENILSPSFTHIGMSRYVNGSVYWAQMFASK